MRNSRKIVISLAVTAIAAFASRSASATCGSTTFQPSGPFIPPGTTHNAYFLTDPASEQTAVFDLAWGGAVASLKQSGVEHVWGSATGAMVQPAWHALSPDYNPTQAGDGSNTGSNVIGVRCPDANTLEIFTSMLDYNRGANTSSPFFAVKNSAVVSGSYSTPYVLLTIATFVANPAGSPSYYLKLQQTITNASPTEALPWGFELAGYVPAAFSTSSQYPTTCSVSTPCTTSSTPHLMGGWYTTSALTSGTAFYVSPSTYFNGANTWPTLNVSPGVYSTYSREVHLWEAFQGLAPGTSKAIVWYVLVGNWTNALSFAMSH